MDVAEFRLIRRPAMPDSNGLLKLLADPPGDPRNGPVARSQFSNARGSFATVFTADSDPLGKTLNASRPPPLQTIYDIIGALSKFLFDRLDHVSGVHVKDALTKLETDKNASSSIWNDWTDSAGKIIPSSASRYILALFGLRQALFLSLNPQYPQYQDATKLTRLALVCDLILSELGGLKADEVFDRLHRRSVVLEGVDATTIAPMAKVKLVSEATCADLNVVRREWVAYLAGEISTIRNLMKGETFIQSDKTTQETETTVVNETQQDTHTEAEQQSKLNSELSQEISDQIAITVNGHASVDATYTAPGLTTSISAGLDASLNIQRSEQHAAKVAREAVSRAVSRVDTRTRESRTRRELMRSEQSFRYSLSNTDQANVHAVYRWVDRVDTYQVFRFPQHFQLEFQLPEPAEFYRVRSGYTQAQADQTSGPPAWDVKHEDITESNLISLAVKYRASNLPPPPDPKIIVTRSLIVKLEKDAIPEDVTFGDDPNKTKYMLNAPTASQEVEIPVPASYAAKKVSVSGEGYPLLGNWVTFTGPAIGFHSGIAVLSIGGHSRIFWNGGISFDKDNNNKPNFIATKGDLQDLGIVEVLQEGAQWNPYGRAMVPIGSDKSLGSLIPEPLVIDLDEPTPPAVSIGATGLVKIGVSIQGLAGCSLAIGLECALTQQAEWEWKLSVYDALYAAWAQWNKEAASNKTRAMLMGANVADAGSSDRNERIIREELKRQVIGWLLDEKFAGRPGLSTTPGQPPDPPEFADINYDKARLDAPLIQFMEQAFEWPNMTYMFYPYYWADRKKWPELAKIVANDPEFERFLKAGSARVIVPARAGFNDAVKNWLMYQIPFMDGQLPVPDDPLYVSIDKEIRDITSPWQGGVAGDFWQSRIGTTQLYLEKEGDLPFYNQISQLPAAEGSVFKPVIIKKPGP